MNFLGRFAVSVAFAAAGSGIVYAENTPQKLQAQYPSLTAQDASQMRYDRAVSSAAFLWAIGGMLAFGVPGIRRNTKTNVTAHVNNTPTP